MNEDVIIRVREEGAADAAAAIAAIAPAADKAAAAEEALMKATNGLDGATAKAAKRLGLTVEEYKAQAAAARQAEAATRAQAASMEAAAASSARASGGLRAFATEAARIATGIGLEAAIRKVATQTIASIGAFEQAEVRIRAYAKSAAETASVSAALTAASNNNSSAVTALVEAYGQLRTSTAFLYTDSSRITSALSGATLAIRASGIASSEAGKGVNSFADAISDGYIDGKEFAALYSQFPVLGQTLASSMGMSAESMKILGISASAATAALTANKASLQAQADASMTVGDAFQTLTGHVTLSIVQFDKATGASAALIKGLKFLTENSDAVASALIGTGGVVAAFVSYNAIIRTATTLTTLFMTVTGAGGLLRILGLVATALGVAAAAWAVYNKSASESVKSSEAASQAAAKAVTAANSAAQVSAQSQTKTTTTTSNRPQTGFGDTGTPKYQSYEEIGARAGGGSVSQGTPYLVGENGPEVFIAPMSGQIVPNGGSIASVAGSSQRPASEDQIRRSVGIFSEAVTLGTDAGFRSIVRAIDDLKDSFKSSLAAVTSTNTGTGTQNTDLIPNVSAINNFGGTGLVPDTTSTVTSTVNNNTLNSGGIVPTGSPTVAIKNTVTATPAQHLEGWFKRADKEWNWLIAQNRLGNKAVRGKVTYENAMQRANVPESIREDVLKMMQGRSQTILAGGTVTQGSDSYFSGRVGAFRSGGNFTVAGSTGVDSKRVSMQVTPGEEVTIKTRRQQREAERNSSDNNGGNTYIFNIETQDADSFKRSEKQILRDFTRKLVRAQGD